MGRLIVVTAIFFLNGCWATMPVYNKGEIHNYLIIGGEQYQLPGDYKFPLGTTKQETGKTVKELLDGHFEK